MSVQIIISPSGERLVVLPEANYEELVSALEDRDDGAAVDIFRRRLAAGEEELLPAEMVDRIIEGENRVKVWREHRGLSAKALAELADIAPAFLSQIETGKRGGAIETLQKLASALHVSVEDIMMPLRDPAHLQIEELLGHEPKRTIADLAASLGFSQNHVGKCCEWLEAEGRLLRTSDQPARFFLRAGDQSSSTR